VLLDFSVESLTESNRILEFVRPIRPFDGLTVVPEAHTIEKVEAGPVENRTLALLLLVPKKIVAPKRRWKALTSRL
jgi:hypothetical protein